MLMPLLQQDRLMLTHNPLNTPKLNVTEVSTPHQRDRIKPELGTRRITPHMNMRRFGSFIAIEV
jgi:hypothetical protein